MGPEPDRGRQGEIGDIDPGAAANPRQHRVVGLKVSHDFGGATALRAHLLDGCEYRSPTLIDAVAIRPWGSAFTRHVRAHEAAFAGMPAYAHHGLLAEFLPDPTSTGRAA